MAVVVTVMRWYAQDEVNLEESKESRQNSRSRDRLGKSFTQLLYVCWVMTSMIRSTELFYRDHGVVVRKRPGRKRGLQVRRTDPAVTQRLQRRGEISL